MSEPGRTDMREGSGLAPLSLGRPNPCESRHRHIQCRLWMSLGEGGDSCALYQGLSISKNRLL